MAFRVPDRVSFSQSLLHGDGIRVEFTGKKRHRACLNEKAKRWLTGGLWEGTLRTLPAVAFTFWIAVYDVVGLLR